MMKSVFALLAALLLAVLPGLAYMEAPDETGTIVTIVRAPEQAHAERPPCFPDPADNYIPLPESTNIAEGKPIQASAHTDIYVSRNLNDGNTKTYWESNGLPAEVTVSLEGTHTVSVVALCLNPSSIWEPRTQEIAVLVSLDGETFTEVSPAAPYTFDAATGNRIRIDLEPAEAAYVRLVITSNTAYPGHAAGAQIAEICIY